MKHNQTALIALTAIAISAMFSGCALLPYESDYSCAYSEGYGKCLGAKDNYELSQMTEQERSKALNKNKEPQEQSNAKQTDCKALRDSCNGDLNELAKFGCLTPLEQTALKNNEALRYIERLLLDREAIEQRTPINENKRYLQSFERADFAISDSKGVTKNYSSAVQHSSSDNIYAHNPNAANDRRFSANVKTTATCDYPIINQGDQIKVLAYRAWLRSSPNANYPATDGLEAKRGDVYTASSSQCGWVRLDNGRYIHQSIVSVIPSNAYETTDEEIEQ
jgi:hypothetical protein